MYTIINAPAIDNIIMLSDIHLGVRNASIDWLDNIKSYFKDFFIPYITSVVDSEPKGKTAALIIAGDFFDCRQHIDINVLNVGIDIMLQLSNIINVFMIVGNHDIYKKEDIDVNSLRIFQNFEHVYIIEEPSILSVSDDVKFALIPWVGSHQKENELLKDIKQYSDYAIMHADISGLIYDNGRAILDGADAKVYGKKIYAGHIHKRQETPGVTYLGSPYQLKRSDLGNTKGVYSLRISNGHVHENFIKNTVSPIFIKVRFTDLLNDTFEKIKDSFCNNYVYVVMTKHESKEVNKSKLIDVLDECGARHLEFLIDSNSSDDEISIIANKDLTINDIFLNNINSFSDLNDNDKNSLIIMNNSYLKEANEELSNLNIIS